MAFSLANNANNITNSMETFVNKCWCYVFSSNLYFGIDHGLGEIRNQAFMKYPQTFLR